MVFAALLVGGVSFIALRSSSDDDPFEQAASEAIAAGVNGVEPMMLRVGSNRTGGGSQVLPPAVSAEGAEGAATTVAPAADTTQPMEQREDKPREEPKPEPKPTYDLVNFVDHVATGLGPQMLAPGQGAFGGYELVAPTEIRARSPITGLWPVIEQAIADVKKQDPGVRGEDLERRVARRLTELNDWDNLNRSTQARIILLSGVDLEAMSEEEREKRVNHILHSPQPFGEIEQVLTPDFTIDMGYTHTLDKEWTNVQDLGDGLFRIWMVSNNNNGSHTGHSLGSFRLQLPPGSTVRQAFDIANEMVINDNNNDRLYLDAAARDVLYGVTPPLDFNKPMTHDHGATTTTAPPATTAPTVAETTTTVTVAETTTTATTAPSITDTTAASTTVSAPAASVG